MTKEAEDTKRRGSHLRLVSVQQPESEPSAQETLDPSQPSLPFPDASAFVFVYVSSMNDEQFRNVIDRCFSSWIVDVRAVPRFDVIAGSRQSAFKLFQQSNAKYIDLFGRLGIQSYRSEESDPKNWATDVSEMLENTQRTGPCVFLFDDENLMVEASQVLREVAQSVVGESAHFSSFR